ncbi:MAG: homocysteine S-methyltransferase family protein [Pikeienuella sp.]
MSPVVLLDGGMGQELITRSRHPVHPLWGAFVMLEEPQIVRDTHRDYLKAGARVLTLNTYSVTHPRLARAGFEDRFDDLHRAAGELARQAVEAERADGVRLAGCLPPIVGSYRPDLLPEEAQALAEYRRIAEAQADAVDLFICETMGSALEARLAATAAAETGKPVWVGITLEDHGSKRLRSGEAVAEAVAALEGIAVGALLANCCHPESIDAAAPDLAASGYSWGGYANAFTSIDALVPGGTVAALEARRDLSPEAYAEWAMRWVAAGARIVGGCCEVGPGHIRALAARLEAAGHELGSRL